MLSPRVPFHCIRNGFPTFQPGTTRPGVTARRVGEAACSTSCEVWSAVPARVSEVRYAGFDSWPPGPITRP